jgi:hypothetical protein
VQARGVDGELDRVADGDLGAGLGDDREGRAVVLGEQDVVVGGGVDRLGQGAGAQARGVDADDHVGLGAEAFDDLDAAGNAGAELEVVRADAEHEPAAQR